MVRRIYLCMLIFAGSLLLLTLPARALKYRNHNLHYQFVLPGGWEEIPKDVIEKASQVFLSRSGTKLPKYEAESASILNGFAFDHSYGHFLVALIPNSTTRDRRVPPHQTTSNSLSSESRESLQIFIVIVAILIGLAFILRSMNKSLERKREETFRHNIERQKAENLVAKGQKLFRSGSYEEALDSLKNAIELNPTYAPAYYYSAAVYNKLGNKKKALDELKAAARLGHEKSRELLEAKGIVWKICPYCAEEIQEEAKKCRYCGEWLSKEKVYAQSATIRSHPSLSYSKEPTSKSMTTFEVKFSNLQRRMHSMSKVSRFFIRFLSGFALAFCWSLFCVLTGIYKQGQVSGLYGWGTLGFFLLGSWLSKKWLDRPRSDKL